MMNRINSIFRRNLPAKILALFETVTEWRPKAKRGKRVYDDHEFVTSLTEQYGRRHSLSPRQLQALKRVAAIYRSQIPNYAAKAAELGLRAGDDDGKDDAE